MCHRTLSIRLCAPCLVCSIVRIRDMLGLLKEEGLHREIPGPVYDPYPASSVLRLDYLAGNKKTVQQPALQPAIRILVLTSSGCLFRSSFWGKRFCPSLLGLKGFITNCQPGGCDCSVKTAHPALGFGTVGCMAACKRMDIVANPPPPPPKDPCFFSLCYAVTPTSIVSQL